MADGLLFGQAIFPTTCSSLQQVIEQHGERNDSPDPQPQPDPAISSLMKSPGETLIKTVNTDTDQDKKANNHAPSKHDHTPTGRAEVPNRSVHSQKD